MISVPTNAPTGVRWDGFLKVEKLFGDTNRIMQTCIEPAGTGFIYWSRRRYNNAWSPWHILYTSHAGEREQILSVSIHDASGTIETTLLNNHTYSEYAAFVLLIGYTTSGKGNVFNQYVDGFTFRNTLIDVNGYSFSVPVDSGSVFQIVPSGTNGFSMSWTKGPSPSLCEENFVIYGIRIV
jgi:hypothetical protein